MTCAILAFETTEKLKELTFSQAISSTLLTRLNGGSIKITSSVPLNSLILVQMCLPIRKCFFFSFKLIRRNRKKAGFASGNI